MRQSVAEMRQYLASKYATLIRRLLALFATAFFLLLARFTIMGFSAPVFKLMDNPASFSDSFVSRVSPALQKRSTTILILFLLRC